MKNKNVYLAGPITGLSYKEATQWRKEIAKDLYSLGYSVLDPMHKKDFLSKKKQLKNNYYNNIITKQDNIFLTDEFRVNSSDIILVNFLNAKQVSIGTTVEIAIARNKKKLVILIMDKNNIHNHIFITSGCIIAKSNKEALNVLKTL